MPIPNSQFPIPYYAYPISAVSSSSEISQISQRIINTEVSSIILGGPSGNQAQLMQPYPSTTITPLHYVK